MTHHSRAVWYAKQHKQRGSSMSYRIGKAEIQERILVTSRGVAFEDCWRLAVMKDELVPQDHLEHLLFDFGTIWSSTQIKDRLRDRILGLVSSPYAAGEH